MRRDKAVEVPTTTSVSDRDIVASPCRVVALACSPSSSFPRFVTRNVGENSTDPADRNQVPQFVIVVIETLILGAYHHGLSGIPDLDSGKEEQAWTIEDTSSDGNAASRADFRSPDMRFKGAWSISPSMGRAWRPTVRLRRSIRE